MAFKLPSGADFGCNRHCKTNPVDLEGSRGLVLMVLGGFRKVVMGGDPFSIVAKGRLCHDSTKLARKSYAQDQPTRAQTWKPAPHHAKAIDKAANPNFVSILS
jgi:hypothetical protein